MFEAYSTSLLGLWFILATISVQGQIATRTHRKQKKMVPGVMDSTLGHESFVFRSDRTFRNSLENIIPLFGFSLLAMLGGLSPYRLAIVVWLYGFARLGHMILYYRIATEKNPSPRTYFYAIGLVSTWYLGFDVGLSLILKLL